jgi:hypothetical protein
MSRKISRALSCTVAACMYLSSYVSARRPGGWHWLAHLCTFTTKANEDTEHVVVKHTAPGSEVLATATKKM